MITNYSIHQALEDYAEQKELEIEEADDDVDFDPESFKQEPPAKRRRL